MAVEHALQAKEKGNKLFLEKKIESSIKQYKEPSLPVKFERGIVELGDYAGAFHAILRSHALQPDPALVLKLSTRLAKTLSYGLLSGKIHATVIEQNLEAIREIEDNDTSGKGQFWKLWQTTATNLASQVVLAREDRVRLSKMLIYKASPDPKLEYFKFGMDEIMSLSHGWGPRDDHPINFQTMSKEKRGQLAFFLGGAGDGRHVHGTIIGLGEKYSLLTAKQKKDVKVHITVNDIHFVAITCNLLQLLLLDELMNGRDELVRLELEATLVYIYVAWIVPDYVHDRLVAFCKTIKQRLTSEPPKLPSWIHVESDSILPITRALDFWIKNTMGAKELLPHVKHEPPSANTSKLSNFFNSIGRENLTGMQIPVDFDPHADDRQDAEMLVDMPDSVLIEMLGGSNENTRDLMKLKRTSEGKKELVDLISNAVMDNVLRWGMVWESKWYQTVKAFVPHGGLIERGKNPGFEYFKDVATKKGSHKAKMSKLAAEVRNTWKANVTILNGENEEYPDDVLNDLEFIGRIAEFNETHDLKISDIRSEREWPVFAHVMTFFGGVMEVIKVMKNRLKVEIICGEVNSELLKMKLGTDSTRPEKFPRQFTRMWVSNVPDYTQGTLGSALYMLPALQNDIPSAVSANCLLNSGIWKNLDEFYFNYTMLLPRDLDRYLGVHTVTSPDIVMTDIQTLFPTAHPRPLSALPSREELHEWLKRLLLWLVYPGRPKARPSLIIIPFSLVAFTQLLAELNGVGYPSHWISDFLQSVLDGTMQANFTTYIGELPRPVSDLKKVTELHNVRLDPWHAEFETILASTKHALPFALLLPDQFASTPEEIGLFKARPAPNMNFSIFSGLVQINPSVALLFYKDLNLRGIDEFLGKTLPALIDGKTKKPEAGSIYIVTSAEGVDLKIPEVRWRMSKARVAKMKQEKWSMVVWRTDHYVATSYAAPAGQWEIIS
ncbi:hypothetical protein CPB83DRAFT_908722 [Crepidotus variabilis]|uniref:DUF4470 domain-containing protein n=1 Tax=Crepidotus variabilis TaxID=179855 RepID=A0A9P6EBT7_9AGAR|nr:hypothetical protein CPB83DRAFT_908722 [Crepidotus variabilis]